MVTRAPSVDPQRRNRTAPPHEVTPLARAASYPYVGGRGGACTLTCGDPRCQHEFCWALPPAPVEPRASHSEVLASVERADTLQLGATSARARGQRRRYFSASAVGIHPHVSKGDAELVSAEDADVPLRWRTALLGFYDHP